VLWYAYGVPADCGGLVMRVRLHDDAELFYTIDDFTDPWTQPETVFLHHGMAKNHKLWYAWIPILAQHYRVVRFDMREYGNPGIPELVILSHAVVQDDRLRLGPWVGKIIDGIEQFRAIV